MCELNRAGWRNKVLNLRKIFICLQRNKNLSAWQKDNKLTPWKGGITCSDHCKVCECPVQPVTPGQGSNLSRQNSSTTAALSQPGLSCAGSAHQTSCGLHTTTDYSDLEMAGRLQRLLTDFRNKINTLQIAGNMPICALPPLLVSSSSSSKTPKASRTPWRATDDITNNITPSCDSFCKSSPWQEPWNL